MSKPLISDVFELSRSRLGDDQVGGGEVFTDPILYPHFAQALRELFRVMRSDQDPYVLREAFWILPVKTGALDPATAGITDLAELEFVQWRPLAAQVTISNVVVSGNSATVTATSHGFLDGIQVQIAGVMGFDNFNSPNDTWTISVIDANTFSLNGCNATGTYTGGGVASTGTGQFQDMDRRDFFDFPSFVPGSVLNPDAIYVWQGGILKFIPSNQDRQLRIIYRSSGQFSSDFASTVPIEDSLDYLAVRAAGLAAKAKGAAETGAELTNEAIGPKGQPDGSGGLLWQLVANQVRAMQAIPYRMPPFRARRNGPTPTLY